GLGNELENEWQGVEFAAIHRGLDGHREAKLSRRVAQTSKIVALSIPVRIIANHQRPCCLELCPEFERGIHAVDVHVWLQVVAQNVVQHETGARHGGLDLTHD